VDSVVLNECYTVSRLSVLFGSFIFPRLILKMEHVGWSSSPTTAAFTSVFHRYIRLTCNTGTEVDGFIWTVAEMCGAVVSACRPTLRPLVTWGKQMSILSSRSRSTQNSNSYAMNDYPRPGPRVVRQNSLSLSRASRGGGFQVLEEHVT